jgi:hypothetical protein
MHATGKVKALASRVSHWDTRKTEEPQIGTPFDFQRSDGSQAASIAPLTAAKVNTRIIPHTDKVSLL